MKRINNYKEFKDALLESIKAAGFECTEHRQLCVNKVKPGYVVGVENGKGGVILTEEKIETLYNDFLQGRPLEDFIREVDGPHSEFFSDGITKCTLDLMEVFKGDNWKKHVFLEVVNTEKNEELLRTVPHREFLDLSVICRLYLTEDEGVTGTSIVNEDTLDFFGITEDELFEIAKENIRESKPYIVIEAGLFKGITNTMGLHGASAILFPEVLEEVADDLNCDLFVIPATIHDIICVPAVSGVADGIREAISIINSTEVPEDEVLSNSLYYFDRTTKQVSYVK